ncbi:unnamed protein product [Alopecurus aequalis]
MRTRLPAGMEVASGRDRLSNLPDCLLHVILSQLRSRQAVQTCALSWRWRHLWLAVPSIRIESKDFAIQDRRDKVYPRMLAPGPGAEEEEALAKLEDFADSILFHRGLSAASSSDSTLDALHLRVRGGGSRRGANLGRWISRGLKLSPAALDICRCDGKPIKLPHVPSSAARRLTRLRLDGVLLHRDFEHLLASGELPVLEDLEIRNAAGSGIERIACDTLRSLTVHLGLGPPVQRHSSHRIAVVVAPLLASLQLEFPLARLANFGFDLVDAKEEPCLLAHVSIGLTPFDPKDTGQLWRPDDYYGSPFRGGGGDEELAGRTFSNSKPIPAPPFPVQCHYTSLHLSGFQQMKRSEKKRECCSSSPSLDEK